MGHLYHGYVSHNQRILFLTLELLFNAESQPIRLQHGTLPQLASVLSLAEPRLAVLWHTVALKFPRNDNVLIKTIGIESGLSETEEIPTPWHVSFRYLHVFSKMSDRSDSKSWSIKGVLRSDNGRLMDMFSAPEKKNANCSWRMVKKEWMVMDSNGEYRVIVMVNTGCTWNALENHLFSCSMLLVQRHCQLPE